MTIRILVTVSGGCVTEILCSDPTATAELIDFDNDGEDEHDDEPDNDERYEVAQVGLFPLSY